MKYVFVDTWGWCALVNQAQPEHHPATLFSDFMDKSVIFLTTMQVDCSVLLTCPLVPAYLMRIHL